MLTSDKENIHSVHIMKIRILFTLIIIAAWGFFQRGLFVPANTLIKNKLAAATVNGGDTAYVAQNAYNVAGSAFSWGAALVLFAALVVIWFAQLKKFWSLKI